MLHVQLLLRSIPLAILDAQLADTTGERGAATEQGVGTTPGSGEPGPPQGGVAATGAVVGGAAVATAGTGARITTEAGNGDTLVLPEAATFESAWRSVVTAGTEVVSRLRRRSSSSRQIGVAESKAPPDGVGGAPGGGGLDVAGPPGPQPRALTMSMPSDNTSGSLANAAAQWVGLGRAQVCSAHVARVTPVPDDAALSGHCVAITHACPHCRSQARLLVAAQRTGSAKKKVLIASVMDLLQCVPPLLGARRGERDVGLTCRDRWRRAQVRRAVQGR